MPDYRTRRARRFLTVIFALFSAAAIPLFSACVSTEKHKEGVEWVYETINRNYYDVDNDDRTYEANAFLSAAKEYSIDYAVGKYLDIYSDYYTAEQYKKVLEEDAGNRSDVGFSCNFAQGKGTFVTRVTGNSPAYISGLRAGEWISGYLKDGELQPFESSGEVSAYIASLKENQTFTLVSASDPSVTYDIRLSSYTASYAYMASGEGTWDFVSAQDGGLSLAVSSRGAISYLPSGAAYIKLSQFYGGAAEQMRVLVKQFNAGGYDTLILDLRSDGGGRVDIMQEIAGCFVPSSVRAICAEYKDGSREYAYCKAPSAEYRLRGGVKVYVLANTRTASASEALIGTLISAGVCGYGDIFLSDYSEEYLDWLESTGSAPLTARTYGKGIMQTTFENYNGEALKITCAKICWDNGRCIHGVGLTADDGCVPVPASWLHTLDDGELRAAVDIIKSRA